MARTSLTVTAAATTALRALARQGHPAVWLGNVHCNSLPDSAGPGFRKAQR